MAVELRIAFNEAKVSIECDYCGAELIVDLSKKDNWKGVDLTCIVCNQSYDEKTKGAGLRTLFQSLSTARRAVSDSALKAFFRFREP